MLMRMTVYRKLILVLIEINPTQDIVKLTTSNITEKFQGNFHKGPYGNTYDSGKLKASWKSIIGNKGKL